MYQTATNKLNQLTDEQDGSPNPHPFTPIGCLIRVIEPHIHTQGLSLHVFFYFVFLSLLLSLTLSYCLALSLFPKSGVCKLSPQNQVTVRHFMQPILHAIIHQTRLNQIFCYLQSPNSTSCSPSQTPSNTPHSHALFRTIRRRPNVVTTLLTL